MSFQELLKTFPKNCVFVCRDKETHKTAYVTTAHEIASNGHDFAQSRAKMKERNAQYPVYEFSQEIFSDDMYDLYVNRYFALEKINALKEALETLEFALHNIATTLNSLEVK